MAIYRATLTIEIERVGGSKTVVTEVVERSVGDNPRFERAESDETAVRATRAVLDRIDPAFADAARA